MNDVTGFLTIMSTLSASAQQLTEHLVKTRSFSKLDTPIPPVNPRDPDPPAERARQTKVHLVCAVFGAGLTGLAQLQPLRKLGADLSWMGGPFLQGLGECVLCGILVSYGGSVFNELLDAVKKLAK
jgi:hypothetical protein